MATTRPAYAEAGETGAAFSGTQATGAATRATVALPGRGHQVTWSAGSGVSGGAPSRAGSTPRSRAASSFAAGRRSRLGRQAVLDQRPHHGGQAGRRHRTQVACRRSTWVGGPPRYGLRPVSSSYSDDAEGVDVAAGLGGAPATTSGATYSGVAWVARAALAVDPAGDAEVGQPDRPAVGRHQQVARLDVAVHDPATVQVGQRVGDLGADVRGDRGRHRAVPAQPAAQVLAVDEVQHERGRAVRR